MEQPSNIVQGTEADPARISTGSAGLDDILCGGLDAERMYLYEGRPGTGKTTSGTSVSYRRSASRGAGPLCCPL